MNDATIEGSLAFAPSRPQAGDLYGGAFTLERVGCSSLRPLSRPKLARELGAEDDARHPEYFAPTQSLQSVLKLT